MTERNPDRELRNAIDDLEAAADLIRPARLDPHTAADLILDTEAHSRCVPNDFCYVCGVQLEQQAGRQV